MRSKRSLTFEAFSVLCVNLLSRLFIKNYLGFNYNNFTVKVIKFETWKTKMKSTSNQRNVNVVFCFEKYFDAILQNCKYIEDVIWGYYRTSKFEITQNVPGANFCIGNGSFYNVLTNKYHAKMGWGTC